MCAYTPPCVYLHNSLVCIHVYLGAELFATIPEADICQQRSSDLVRATIQKQNPPQTNQTHKKTLTGILYLSTVVFHHYRPKVTLFSTECCFLWDVRACEIDPQPSVCPLSSRLSQVVSVLEMGLSAVTSYPHKPTNCSSIIVFLIITADRLSRPLRIPKESGAGRWAPPTLSYLRREHV